MLPGISVFLCPCHLVASLQGSHRSRLTVGRNCWAARPLCASVTQRDHWGKRVAFLSASDSVRPFDGRWAKSGFSLIPGGSLILNPWLHSQKLGNVDPPKGLAPIQTGDPPEMASEWHTRFCQRKGKDSEFPCVLLPPCLLCPSVSLHQIS